MFYKLILRKFLMKNLGKNWQHLISLTKGYQQLIAFAKRFVGIMPPKEIVP